MPPHPYFQPLALILACLLPTSLAWSAPPEIVTFHQPEKGDPLELHIFSPPNHDKSEAKPGIVLFFGGGWRRGKPGALYTQAKYLASRGFVAISAQYRTKESHDVYPDKCVADGRSAMRYVRANAKKFGIDPDRLLAGGGSAGGHVAACTALEGAPNNPGDDLSVSPKPAALVLLNPVLDVGPDGYAHGYVKHNTPDWKAINPKEAATKSFPPSLILFGDQDKILPVAMAKAFQKRMNELKVPVETRIYAGAGHGFFNKQPYRDATLLEIDKFLTSQGYLEGEPTIKTENLPTPSG